MLAAQQVILLSRSGRPTTWTFTASHAPYTAASPAATLPTQANMSDGVATTYYATDTNATSWLQADFGRPVDIATVYVADCAGTASWSNVYTNGRTIEGSQDSLSWTTLATLSGHANDGVERPYAIEGRYRYLRVFSSGTWFGVSQFRFF